MKAIQTKPMTHLMNGGTLKRGPVTVEDMHLRFAAEANEGARKNEEARRLGQAPSRIVCPKQRQEHDHEIEKMVPIACTADCESCRGFGWIWSDGRPPQMCPVGKIAPCPRPWCWCCRNGARPKMERAMIQARLGVPVDV